MNNLSDNTATFSFHPWVVGISETPIRTGGKDWKLPRKWNRDAEAFGGRALVLCSDVFKDWAEVGSWREELFGLIGDTPNLIWLLHTHYPENIDRMFLECVAPVRLGWGDFPNIWVGTSAENQDQADLRVSHLVNVPARMRFLHCEPLTGEVSLARWLTRWPVNPATGAIYRPFNWVTVGGSYAQPMQLDWARSLRDECRKHGIAFYMKQVNGIDPTPDDLRIRQFPQVVNYERG